MNETPRSFLDDEPPLIYVVTFEFLTRQPYNKKMTDDTSQLIETAWNKRREGQPAAALELLSAVYQQAQRSKDQALLLAVAGKLAHVLLDLDRLQEAEELYNQAVTVSQQLGDDCQLAYFLRHQADLWRRQGRGAETRDAYQQAIRLIRSCGGEDSLELANAQRGLALWLEQDGQPQQSLSLWQNLQVLYERLGIHEGAQEAGQHIVLLTPSRSND